MVRERGGSVFHFLWATALVIVLLFLAVCVLAGNGKDDHKGVPGVVTYQLISERGCDPDWDDCGNSGYNDGGYGQGRNSGGGGGNGNRGRKGDRQDSGRDSCHSFCGNTIIVPDPTKKDQPPPKDQQPKSLTDPRKLPMVIAQITKSGLDMGQLFATTTIKFVEDLFTALA